MKMPWYRLFNGVSQRCAEVENKNFRLEQRISELERKVRELNGYFDSITMSIHPDRVQDLSGYRFGAGINLPGLRAILFSIVEYLGLEIVGPKTADFKVQPKPKAEEPNDNSNR